MIYTHKEACRNCRKIVDLVLSWLKRIITIYLCLVYYRGQITLIKRAGATIDSLKKMCRNSSLQFINYYLTIKPNERTNRSD